jgi:hypothetical protein
MAGPLLRPPPRPLGPVFFFSLAAKYLRPPESIFVLPREPPRGLENAAYVPGYTESQRRADKLNDVWVSEAEALLLAF